MSLIVLILFIDVADNGTRHNMGAPEAEEQLLGKSFNITSMHYIKDNLSRL